MLGCCFQDVETVVTDQLADPRIESPSDAIVKVQTAGLCGSDLHPFFGRESGIDVGTVMGHEFVGTVVEVGTSVEGVEVGDRVCCSFTTSCGNCYFCRHGLTSRCVDSQLFGWRENQIGLHGGQAEYVRVPNAGGSLLSVDSGVSNDAALLLGDNLSTGFYCAEMAEIQPDGCYLVIGCGTVGVLAIIAALRMGAHKVFAFDLDPSRLALAEEVGALPCSNEQSVLSEVRGATGNRGADGVMELVGLLPAQELAFQAVRAGGILSTVGCHCTPHFGFSPADLYDKNLTYRTGRCPARHYMDRLRNELDGLDLPFERLITHRFPLTDSARAYEVFSQRKEACMKAVFDID